MTIGTTEGGCIKVAYLEKDFFTTLLAALSISSFSCNQLELELVATEGDSFFFLLLE
jgi:hypothetical protein